MIASLKKLLSTQINDALSLHNSYFDNPENNIDHLVESALQEDDHEKQLTLLLRAAKECEKFHSYFHFEESFFYLTYGDFLLSKGHTDETIEKYKLSIIQYPSNSDAYTKMIKLMLENGMTDEAADATSRAKLRNLSIKETTQMSRPFGTFKNYVIFAANNEMFDGVDILPSFWLSFENHILTQDPELLDQAILQVKHNHQLYHHNAAKIYYNCSIVHHQLGREDLAKNALVKSRNLDASLTESVTA